MHNKINRLNCTFIYVLSCWQNNLCVGSLIINSKKKSEKTLLNKNENSELNTVFVGKILKFNSNYETMNISQNRFLKKKLCKKLK